MLIFLEKYKSNIIVLILMGILLYSVAHYFSTGVIFSFTRSMSDGDLAAMWPTFWAWKLNPEFILQNTSQVSTYTVENKEYWQYGPMLHYVLFPFLFFKSYVFASKFWLVICHVLVLLTMFIWYKILFLDKNITSWKIAVIYIAIWLNFFPLYECLSTRNIEILEMFFLTFSFYFLHKERKNLSGIFLGLSVMTKFLPAIFIPYFLLKRQYKLFFASMITILVVFTSAQFTLGWENNMIFGKYGQLNERGSKISTIHDMQAIPNVIARYFSQKPIPYDPKSYHGAPLNNTELVSWIVKIVIFSLIGFFITLFLVVSRNSKISLFEISILCILMLTLIQSNHIYYFIFLLIPFSVFFQYIVCNFKFNFQHTIEITLFIISYFLLAVVVPLSFLQKMFSWKALPFLEIYQYYSLPAYGYLLLLAWLTFRLAGQERSKQTVYIKNTNQQSPNMSR